MIPKIADLPCTRLQIFREVREFQGHQKHQRTWSRNCQKPQAAVHYTTLHSIHLGSIAVSVQWLRQTLEYVLPRLVNLHSQLATEQKVQLIA